MRREGWESLLADHIRQAYHVPFQWGANDCALWTSDWVRLATGDDFSGGMRGKYRSRSGAYRVLKQLGFKTVEELADAYLPEIPIALARRGDILLHAEGSLGICHGTHGFFLTETGVVMAAGVKAWAVR